MKILQINPSKCASAVCETESSGLLLFVAKYAYFGGTFLLLCDMVLNSPQAQVSFIVNVSHFLTTVATVTSVT